MHWLLILGISVALGVGTLFVLNYGKDVPSQLTEVYSTQRFTVEPITCVYPISGQYGQIPRWTYYLLLVTIVVLRDQPWLALAAAGSASTFSGVAAVHGTLLFFLPARDRVCEETVPLSAAGSISICPGVDDLDAAVITSITGAAVIALVPIAAWSSTFRRLGAKLILVCWAILVAIGLTFTNLRPFNAYSQVRSCPLGRKDPLPLSNNHFQNVDDWNTTVWERLGSHNDGSDTHCLYPCFGFNEILRSNSEIVAFPPSLDKDFRRTGERSDLPRAFWVGWVACVIAALLRSRSRLNAHSERKSYSQQRARGILDDGRLRAFPYNQHWTSRFARIVDNFFKVLGAVLLLGYVPYVEWQESPFPEDEGFNHVGQWSTVVIVILVICGASLGRYEVAMRKSWRHSRWNIFANRQHNAADTVALDHAIKDTDIWDCRCGCAS